MADRSQQKLPYPGADYVGAGGLSIALYSIFRPSLPLQELLTKHFASLTQRQNELAQSFAVAALGVTVYTIYSVAEKQLRLRHQRSLLVFQSHDIA